MMKQIFCLFLGLFFTLGFYHLLNQDSQELQTQLETVDIQPYTQLNHNESVTAINQTYGEDCSIKSHKYHCSANNIISGNLPSPPNSHLSKIRTFNPISSVLQLLSSLESQLSKNKGQSFSPTINFLQSSCRYYIYMLRHILI